MNKELAEAFALFADSQPPRAQRLPATLEEALDLWADIHTARTEHHLPVAPKIETDKFDDEVTTMILAAVSRLPVRSRGKYLELEERGKALLINATPSQAYILSYFKNLRRDFVNSNPDLIQG